MQESKTLAQGRYEIVGALGEGGMAYVFTAYDTRLRVERAIKVLAPRLFSNRKIRERFESEAATMAQLHHKNILTIHDIGNEDQMVYMVMEMLLGGSLMDRIEDHGVLHPQLAISAAIEMAAGLGFAHKNKVIHRDVKPHNVLISRDGIMKVADFGIARIEDGLSSQTRTGAVMGTLAYMAPEQKLSARKATARSDLYAVAASLYVMLTDDNPFELYDEEVQDEKLSSMIPEFAAFIRKGCHFDPNLRHQDAEEMIAELEGLRTFAPELSEDALPLYIESEHKPTPKEKEARLHPMWYTMMSEVSEDSSFSGSSVSSGSDASDTVDFDLFSSQHDSDASDENLDDIVAAKTIGLDFEEPIAEQHTILPPQDEIPTEISHSEKTKEGTAEVSSKEESKSSRLLPMFIMLLGAIVGVLFMALNKQPEQVPEATKSTVEEQKSVVVKQKKEPPAKEIPTQEPEKVVKAVEVAPPPQKESTPPPTKTVSKVASKTKTKTKTKTKKAEKPVEDTKVEKKATGFGFVTINALPMRGLTITINGKTSNRPLRKLKVPVGTHKYTIQHKDKSKTGKIVVKKDELKRICWNFRKDSEC